MNNKELKAKLEEIIELIDSNRINVLIADIKMKHHKYDGHTKIEEGSSELNIVFQHIKK